MAFKAFERKRTHGGEAAVAITKHGMLVLNAACVDAYFKGKGKKGKDIEYAKLFWDEEHNKVGIKPMDESDKLCYSVNYSKNGTVATFSGIAFVKFIKLVHKETKAYPVTWDAKEKLLVFSVREEGGRK